MMAPLCPKEFLVGLLVLALNSHPVEPPVKDHCGHCVSAVLCPPYCSLMFLIVRCQGCLWRTGMDSG
ncbi:hypothetical protein DPMN_013816 [Dreissena polymorpha]|uniref:Secreted protein n=1 Tax=Dreissena polymorpha TaxID=45954 RepID=A0A9D4IU20_DREPO|nr:hypothetical protein DPMN_163012 [Dreissena polymorpha]KAH3889754.1 hypothetical protein DPMN_013816 [Dreissena polymorpha]